MNGMQNMMKQAQKLQKQMMKMQEELSSKEYESAAGGDMVTVKVNGQCRIKSIKIAKEVIDPEDIEMLEDLIISAINEAIKLAQEDQNKSMSSLTGGVNIPGLNL